MKFESRNSSWLILGVLAVVLSRSMLAFFQDAEGPNLLVVSGMAVIVFIPSLAAYLVRLSGVKRLVLAIIIQVIMVTLLYFLLR